ncbi:hypothetical protein [Novosphingobium sp.]|uniref:hypothetical protein n=1 Tax=Novosphingobium sp. TaxID=1874826 RepID=UPI001EBDC7B2|nr:hypothetical protein [Novosphingobium sp.]MBK9011755.1 hypothetical protein [Novosphingobium sp.]
MDLQAISNQEALDGIELLLARSDFLDAFADLETAVLRVLRSCGTVPKGEPFSQRVKALKTAEKTTLIAKSNHAQRDQIADEIMALLQIRADIVHSRMSIRTIDGKLAAFFLNVQETGALFPACRILNHSELKQLSSMVTRLTERISALNRVNPASSPRPPSLGGAGVP